MHNFDTLTVLSKAALRELLYKRFNNEEKKLSHIPNPSLLGSAEVAAKKIAQTIRDKKRITLIGDYDVDGVSSSAIVVNFFNKIPYPIEAIIPNRFNDGYGISPNILKRVDTDLIITVDNGISAIDAADICRQRGIELIITDHHTPLDTLPMAYAIVNPKLNNCSYPIKEICGAQVAWLVLALLKKELNLDIDMKEFIDILSIAIIADIMPLVDINRVLVKEGLKLLLHSNKPYATIIRDFLNKKSISSEDIGFQIAPRLNSAGRLGDASIALEFLTTPSPKRAYELFEQLNSLNELRKEEEAAATKEAIVLCDTNDKILVVAKELWHEGVVGIVASKLVEHFSKPAIVLSIEDGIAKGSARSLANVNIHNLIKESSHLLFKFGGHKMAAGLSLDENHINTFRKTINKNAQKLNNSDFISVENIIGILQSYEIDLELLEILEIFEPYGEANQRPLFLVRDADIVRLELFGKEKNHSKIIVKQSRYDNEIELISFKNIIKMPSNGKITCSYRVTKNEFNSKISTQLIINKIYNS